MPRTWWLRHRVYFLFMVRELTSVFIAVYLVLFLLMLHRLAAGREPYEAYLRFLARPGMLAFHVVALAAALYHSVTWFNVTPMVMPLQVGEKRVPPMLIVGVNYVAWIALSIAVAALVMRG
jgi:fumarate reductase subunit C